MRDPAKMKAAAEKAGVAATDYAAVELQLASLQSVKDFTKDLKGSLGQRGLDRLVCNAVRLPAAAPPPHHQAAATRDRSPPGFRPPGRTPPWRAQAVYLPTDPKPRFTDDGFEMSLGVNHLGHFLLVQVAPPQPTPASCLCLPPLSPSLSLASAWPQPQRRVSPPLTPPRVALAAASAAAAARQGLSLLHRRLGPPQPEHACTPYENTVHVRCACQHACMPACPHRAVVVLTRAYTVQVTGNKNTVAGSLVKPVADVGELAGLANGAGEVMVDGAKKFDGAKAYKDAKALNMMTVLELHRRLGKKTGTTYNSM